MPKKGADRAKKFDVKHDTNVLLLRWKALKNSSVQKASTPLEQHSELDDLINWVVELYNIGYGLRAVMGDIIRQTAFTWHNLTDVEKQVWLNKWLSKGLSSESFTCIQQINKIILEKQKIFLKENFCVSFEVDVFPYPYQAYVSENEEVTLEYMAYFYAWRQKNLKYHVIDYFTTWSSLSMDSNVEIKTDSFLTPYPQVEYLSKINAYIEALLNGSLVEPYNGIMSLTKNIEALKTTILSELFSTLTTKKIALSFYWSSFPCQDLASNLNTSFQTWIT